ncbi:hypothetical protein [Mycolicibacterium arenosum]|uniref:Porin n=1 Tax=Mycolicibacterium arenosum TaxID=2952157 RepID=A0ABT1MC53_9MYCO|nr:hypothetical protein [Mycolicibacterium sp. CAU 1645]MCP9276726.1 hypothetical protein [Mycolicibacterium sp. CAU 1645]
MNSIRKSIVGAALAGGLLLGAPVLATLAAAPASADSGIVFQDGNGGGFAIGDDSVAFGNGNGDGAVITDDGFGFRVGGLQLNLDD